jgi:hypothetical protein
MVERRPEPNAIHPDVRRAVLAWAHAPDFKAANRALVEAVRTLKPELKPQLIAEVAEINAESIVRLLDKPDDSEPDPATEEVFGIALGERQLDRLMGWLYDQRSTAESLGLELEAWMRALEAGMVRTLDAHAGEQERPPARPGADPELAKKLLGTPPQRFQNRSPAELGAARGVLSVLAAKRFKN